MNVFSIFKGMSKEAHALGKKGKQRTCPKCKHTNMLTHLERCKILPWQPAFAMGEISPRFALVIFIQRGGGRVMTVQVFRYYTDRG